MKISRYFDYFIKRKNILLIFFFTVSFHFLPLVYGNDVKAQDSSRLQISLLTCAPGTELYSTFGHSALRVIDSNFVADVVYNYGTFDFSDPNFYSKFVRGKLLYFLSVEATADFKANYQQEGQAITEQVLNLSPQAKKEIRDALSRNIQSDERFYLYDFSLDNCTTRLRDLIEKYQEPKPDFPPVMPITTTFRNAIHQYLDLNQKNWSKLGIDLLLGAPTDVVMTTKQQSFLPDNLMFAIDSVKNISLVQSKTTDTETKTIVSTATLFTPLFCSSAFAILYAAIALWCRNSGRRKFSLQYADRILFFITGALGCLFLFMWAGSDHSMTKQNYNLLWAVPMNVILAFINWKTTFGKKWLFGMFALSVLLLIAWSFLPQQLNLALIPIVLLLSFRYADHAFYRPIKISTEDVAHNKKDSIPE